MSLKKNDENEKCITRQEVKDLCESLQSWKPHF